MEVTGWTMGGGKASKLWEVVVVSRELCWRYASRLSLMEKPIAAMQIRKARKSFMDEMGAFYTLDQNRRKVPAFI
jgi:hypothetical protein